MEVMPEIKNRSSVRSFLDQPIDKAILDRILEAGRLAPSAKNRQPWRFILIKDKSMRAKICEAAYGEEWIAQAPALIAICTTNIDYKMPNGILAYPVDLSFAASFMALQAEHEGLGCCINTTFQEQEVKDLLTVPHSMRVVVLLILGHPADKKESTSVRLASSRVVSVDHW